MAQEYEFYRSFSKPNAPARVPANNDIMYRNYNRASNKSIASDTIKPLKKLFKNNKNLAKTAAILATTVIVASSVAVTLGIEHIVEEVKEVKAVEAYCEENDIADMLRDSSWRYTSDNGFVYGYNQNTLADYVDASDNPDLTLFGFYHSIDMQKQSNLNEIVTRMDGNYDSWNDYLTKKGFVDKNGEPSNKVYRETMEQRILMDQELGKMEKNHGIKR